MSDSFSQLKKSSISNLDNLTQELNKLSEGSSAKTFGPDERLWKLTVDKAQNGHAVIRFLPAAKGESLPWVRKFSHGIQGPGNKWFIEMCPTTLNLKCPVCEINTEAWNSGDEAGKDLARKRKRKLQYVSNIQVVTDPGNPDNEGKVFLFEYGKKIFDMVNDVMHPEFEDETPMNPFDFWEGANFRLRAKKVAGYRNYDKSEFETASPLLDDDAELEKVWESQHSLEELVAPDQFKSYDELKSRLDKVLGNAPVVSESAFEDNVAPLPVSNHDEPMSGSEEEDESLSYFKKLAEEA
jgi:hypothetical protein